jgi:hypothetical protein
MRPKVYQDFVDRWDQAKPRQAALDAYAARQRSFVPGLLPQSLLQLSGAETLDLLRRRFGQAIDAALDPACCDPDGSPDALPSALQSPVASQPDGAWLKRANMAGVNVRTVGSFWNVVKYALTLPDAQGSIHILPIWEVGVAGSMYGIASWNLNPEFYSVELAELAPGLDSLDRQLRAVVHLLHVMGKTVGMDVIPHTDRFSQIVLAFPEHFEWLQREDTEIVDHRADLHEHVQAQVAAFLRDQGAAVPGDPVPGDLFCPSVDPDRRMRVLFGLPGDQAGRERRRTLLIQHLYRYGYEPVPATMARSIPVQRPRRSTRTGSCGEITALCVQSRCRAYSGH